MMNRSAVAVILVLLAGCAGGSDGPAEAAESLWEAFARGELEVIEPALSSECVAQFDGDSLQEAVEAIYYFYSNFQTFPGASFEGTVVSNDGERALVELWWGAKDLDMPAESNDENMVLENGVWRSVTMCNVLLGFSELTEE